MVRIIVLLAVVAGVAWYFYRDPINTLLGKPAPAAQKMYRWKDELGKVHYSSSKADAPRGAQPADLPEIGIMSTDKAALDKQAERLKAKEQESKSGGDLERPKLPQVRNLAIERMEKATDKLSK